MSWDGVEYTGTGLDTTAAAEDLFEQIQSDAHGAIGANDGVEDKDAACECSDVALRGLTVECGGVSFVCRIVGGVASAEVFGS